MASCSGSRPPRVVRPVVPLLGHVLVTVDYLPYWFQKKLKFKREKEDKRDPGTQIVYFCVLYGTRYAQMGTQIVYFCGLYSISKIGLRLEETGGRIRMLRVCEQPEAGCLLMGLAALII